MQPELRAAVVQDAHTNRVLMLAWMDDEALRLTPIAAVQNRCNVLDTRDFDVGLVAYCAELGIAYVPYSPVGGHSGHRRLDQYPALARVAEKHGTTPYVIALAWLLAQGAHILPIPGATKVSSVESSLTAPRVRLDADRGVVSRL